MRTITGLAILALVACSTDRSGPDDIDVATVAGAWLVSFTSLTGDGLTCFFVSATGAGPLETFAVGVVPMELHQTGAQFEGSVSTVAKEGIQHFGCSEDGAQGGFDAGRSVPGTIRGGRIDGNHIRFALEPAIELPPDALFAPYEFTGTLNQDTTAMGGSVVTSIFLPAEVEISGSWTARRPEM